MWRLWIITTLCLASGLLKSQTEKSLSPQDLSSVLDQFSQDHDLRLAYDKGSIGGIRVEISQDQADPISALYEILNAAGLEYYAIDDDKILIRRKQETPRSEKKYWTIEGQVRDAKTKEALAFATIFDLSREIGTVADETGHFSLRLPSTQDTARLVCNYLSYQEYQTTTVPSDRARLDILLTSSQQKINLIIVSDDWTLPRWSSDKQSISLSGAKKSGIAQFGSSIRSIQLLPGVNAINDRSAALKIRGAKTEESHIHWDGMQLLKIDKLFSSFSSVNESMVARMTLHKNFTPIQYGGRSGSVLEIESPDEFAQGSGFLSVSNLLTQASRQFGFGNDLHLQIGGRFTMNSIIRNDFFNQLNQDARKIEDIDTGDPLQDDQRLQISPEFKFFDGNLKLVKNWENSLLTISGFHARDQYDYDFSFDFRTRPQLITAQNTLQLQENTHWTNTAMAAKWKRTMSQEREQEWNIGYSENKSDGKLDLGFNRQGPINSNSSAAGIFQSNDINHYHLSWKESQEAAAGSWSYGIRSSLDKTNSRIANDSILVIDFTEEQWQVAPFVLKKWNWRNTIGQVGLHSSYYSGTSQIYWSPRLSLSHSLSDHAMIKLAFQHQQQFLQSFYHENRFGRSFQLWVLSVK